MYLEITVFPPTVTKIFQSSHKASSFAKASADRSADAIRGHKTPSLCIPRIFLTGEHSRSSLRIRLSFSEGGCGKPALNNFRYINFSIINFIFFFNITYAKGDYLIAGLPRTLRALAMTIRRLLFFWLGASLLFY